MMESQYGIRGFTTLIPQAYDPAFTNFKRRLNPQNPDGSAPVRDGPIRTTPIPFAVEANAPAKVIASQDAFRKGLLIKNLDATELLYVGIGSLADTNGLAVNPGGTILFDFICPTDTISVFATANVRGYLALFAPIG